MKERVTLGPVDQMCEDRLGEVREREEREKREREKAPLEDWRSHYSH